MANRVDMGGAKVEIKRALPKEKPARPAPAYGYHSFPGFSGYNRVVPFRDEGFMMYVV